MNENAESLQSKKTWDSAWQKRHREFGSPRTRGLRAAQKISNIVAMGFERECTDSLILDVGCGTGEVSELLKQMCTRVIAVDISPVALRRFQRRLGTFQIPLTEADISRLPIKDESVDHIICLGVHEHLKDTDRFWKEISRVLKPNGLLCLSNSNKYSFFWIDRLLRQFLGIWPYGYQRNFTPSGLIAEFDENFTVEQYRVDLPGSETPFYLKIDSLLSRLPRPWGRTIYVMARKKYYGDV